LSVLPGKIIPYHSWGEKSTAWWCAAVTKSRLVQALKYAAWLASEKTVIIPIKGAASAGARA
jgi:hypothetical protein